MQRSISMNRTRHIYTLFSLTLFLLFVIGSFFVVTYEIKGYQHIYESGTLQDDLTTPLAYLNTKIKSYDQKDAISIVEIDHISCLSLSTLKTTTYIYYQDGYLKEYYTLSKQKPVLDEGTALFALDDFSMEEQHHLFHFVVYKDGLSQDVSLYKHS